MHRFAMNPMARQGIRPALQLARLLRQPSITAPSVATRRCMAMKAGKSRPPLATKSNPRFNASIAPSIPRFASKLNFAPCTLTEFEEAAKRHEGFINAQVPRLHGIYLAFFEAVKQAAVTKNTRWEDEFFTEANATSKTLYDAAVLAGSLKNGQLSQPERLLYLYMLDTAGEKGHHKAAMSMVLYLMDMGAWDTAKAIYPRAVQRVRLIPRDDKLADLPVIMGIIHVREGRDAEALTQFQTARRLADASPDVEFQTEAICALELGKLLIKKGDRAAALQVFEDALKFDTREICYETAMLLGRKEDERRRRALLNKAAVTGHVDAIKAMATLEFTAHEEALAAGGQEEAAQGHLLEALEWQNLVKAWEADPKDAGRHF